MSVATNIEERPSPNVGNVISVRGLNIHGEGQNSKVIPEDTDKKRAVPPMYVRKDGGNLVVSLTTGTGADSQIADMMESLLHNMKATSEHGEQVGIKRKGNTIHIKNPNKYIRDSLTRVDNSEKSR